MAVICAIISFALFLLAAFGVKLDAFEIVPMGLAFLALAIVLSNLGWGSFRRNP